MTREKNVYDRLSKELRKDLVIGGFLACFVAISSLFGWGMYNAHRVEVCHEHFIDFTVQLENRAEVRAREKEREVDSLRNAVQQELNSIRQDQKEVKVKLKNIKRS